VEQLIQELLNVKFQLVNLRELLKDKEKIRLCYVAQAFLNAAIERIDENIEKPVVMEED
jgi:RecB family exonuclease